MAHFSICVMISNVNINRHYNCRLTDRITVRPSCLSLEFIFLYAKKISFDKNKIMMIIVGILDCFVVDLFVLLVKIFVVVILMNINYKKVKKSISFMHN